MNIRSLTRGDGAVIGAAVLLLIASFLPFYSYKSPFGSSTSTRNLWHSDMFPVLPSVTLTAIDKLQPADAVVFAVAHSDYVGEGWPLMTRLLKNGKGTVVDVKSKLDRAAKPEGIDLWRL